MKKNQVIDQKHSECLSQITHAQHYFGTQSGLALNPDGTGSGNKFTGSDGLFASVFAGKHLFTDPTHQHQVTQANYYLQGFTTLVTEKLLGTQEKPSFNIPAIQVLEVAKHLPLLGAFESGTVENNISTTTTSFSTKFLKLALDIAIDNPTILTDAEDFISSLGNEIKLSHAAKSSNYAVTMFSGNIETKKVDGVDILVPQLKITSTTLAIKDVKVSLFDCINHQSFTLAYKAETFAAAIDIELLNNPQIKAEIDKLITNSVVNKVKQSGNYFSPGS